MNLRVECDREVDAVYVCLANEILAVGVARTVCVDPQEIGGMVNLDLDREGRAVGLEMSDGSTLLRSELLSEE